MSWTLFFCLLSYSLFAQTDLEVIEVKAEKDIKRFTFSSSHEISSRTLETQPLSILSPELEKIPGLVPSQNGGPGGRVTFFLRGTESRHLSFNLDGLKINDASNTDRQFDAAFMTTPFLKSVTVHKGPQAVLFGSDALSGMIELVTRKGENAPEGRIAFTTGSFGTIGSSLTKDWKTHNSQGTVSLLRLHSDGISRLNEKRFNAKEIDSTDITQLTSSSQHKWMDKFQTDVLVGQLRGEAEQDGYGDDNSFDLSRNDQYLLQQKTSFFATENQSLSFRTGLNRHQRFNRSLAQRNEFYNGNLYQNELIHRYEHGGLGLLSGLSSEHETAKTRDLDKDFNLQSLFVQSALEKGLLKFHLGGRLDHHSKYGSFKTGAGGVSYRELSLQYSQGYKAPSLFQLFAPNTIGNKNLVPEVNHYLELLWERKKETFETSFALFQNRLSNQFDFVFGLGYVNQKRFTAEGGEISAKIKRRHFDLMTSFTHQAFRETEGPVLRRPYNSALVGVSVFPQDLFEINLTTRWFSSRKDFEAKLNSFEVVDMTLKKTWDQSDISLQIRNILNREYEEIYGYSVLPLSFFSSYGYRF
jgi:vitamin B12 transporter